MARAATKEVEDTTEDEGGLRSRMYLHEDLVDYINTEYGVDLDTLSAAEVVAFAFAKRNEWRKTERYASIKEEHASTNGDEAAPAKKTAPKKATAKKAAPAKSTAKKAPAKKATGGVRKATRGAAASEEENPFD